MGELGDRLRRAREARGLSLDQVEEITKIRRRYLEALEEEDFGQLPGEVFVRGFLRNYAVALGLDAEETLAAAGRQVAAPVVPAQDVHQPLLDEPLNRPAIGQHLLVWAFAGMIVILIGLGGWTLYQAFGPGRTPPSTS